MATQARALKGPPRLGVLVLLGLAAWAAGWISVQPAASAQNEPQAAHPPGQAGAAPHEPSTPNQQPPPATGPSGVAAGAQAPPPASGKAAAPPAPPSGPAEPATPKPLLPGHLANGGFEEGLAGWQVTSEDPRAVTIDPSAAKSGRQSLRLWAPRSGINPSISQDLTLPGAAGWLRLSFSTRATLRGPSRLVVRLEPLDADGQLLGRYYVQQMASNPGRWQSCTADLPLSPQAARLRLTLRLVGTGGLWLDDLKSTFTAAALLVMPRRVATREGEEASPRLTLWACPEAPLTASLGKVALPAPRREGESVVITLPALRPGRQLLELRSGEVADRVGVWTTYAQRRPSMLSEAGWWEREGRSSLPSFLLHGSPSDAQAAAEQGFAAIELLPPSGGAGMRSLLKALPQDALPLVLPLAYRPGVQGAEGALKGALEAVAEASHERRLLAWLVADEPDLRLDFPEAPQLYLQTKRADRLHPLLMTLGSVRELEFWANFADGVLINCCSLGADPLAVYQLLRQASSRLEPWQPLGAVLPAGWGPGTVQPDGTQARLLAFSAVAAGARCLAWYCLRATGWDLRATPLWPSFRALHDDLSKLAAAVAGKPRADDLLPPAASLIAAAWGTPQDRTVLIVNPDSAPLTVNLPAPAAGGEVKHLLGEAATQGGERGIVVAGRSVCALRVTAAEAASPPAPSEGQTATPPKLGNQLSPGPSNTSP
jgi:hypothetical protein